MVPKKNTLDQKLNPINLKLKCYIYDRWFTEESDDSTVKGDKKELDNLQSIPSLEGGEAEVKEGKGFKILTPNKLLTKLKVLLPQIKAGNNSHKLRGEIKQILYLLYQHNKITRKFATI